MFNFFLKDYNNILEIMANALDNLLTFFVYVPFKIKSVTQRNIKFKIKIYGEKSVLVIAFWCHHSVSNHGWLAHAGNITVIILIIYTFITFKGSCRTFRNTFQLEQLLGPVSTSSFLALKKLMGYLIWSHEFQFLLDCIRQGWFLFAR